MSKIIKLNESFSVVLRPTVLFNFDAAVRKPSHFPSSDNIWEKGGYWITMIWKHLPIDANWPYYFSSNN